MPWAWTAVACSRGRGSALGEPPNSRALASASPASTIGASGFNDASRRTRSSGTRRQVGLGQEQQVGHGGLRDGLGITIERGRADHGIDRRHDAVEPQRGLEKGVGGERVERGPGIGQAAGLERDAPERRPAGGLPRSQQPVERVGQALAHGAAGAAVGQLDHIVDRRLQQMMVERDGAELADERRRYRAGPERREPGREAWSCRCPESRSAPRAGSAPTGTSVRSARPRFTVGLR